jgi:hypothetical protein
VFLVLLRHPLFLLVVGGIFSTLLSRWWQTRQKELETRTELVSDIAESVMTFDRQLRKERRALYSCAVAEEGGKEDPNDEAHESIESHRITFDISRCIIHTKLEAYFPERPRIANDWTGLADGFLTLSHCLDDRTAVGFSEAERDRLAQLASREMLWRAQGKASERGAEVGPEWAEIEELLLAEKVRLIEAVRNEPMHRHLSVG